jgi:hypothetical protein
MPFDMTVTMSSARVADASVPSYVTPFTVWAVPHESCPTTTEVSTVAVTSPINPAEAVDDVDSADGDAAQAVSTSAVARATVDPANTPVRVLEARRDTPVVGVIVSPRLVIRGGVTGNGIRCLPHHRTDVYACAFVFL